MIPIDSLFTPSTREQVLETWLGQLEALGLPARSWRRGGVARSILSVVAVGYAGFTDLVATIAKSAFIDYAEAGSLTLLARYLYGVERRPAVRATGLVRLDNAGGGIFSFGVGEFRVFNPTTRATYTNSEAFSLGALQTGLSVAIVAETAGSASSSLPGNITGIETTALRVSCINETSVIGSDEESDDELRQACRDRVAVYGAGAPRGAYAFWSRRATRLDGTFADINRVSVSRSSTTGRVTVYVASPSGTPAVDDVAAVAAALEKSVRPDTVTVDVFPATTRIVPVAATVWVEADAGETESGVSAASLSALAALQKSWPIGGHRKGDGTLLGLASDRIKSAIIAARPGIFDVDGIDVDVTLLDNEVPVFAPSLTVLFEVRA